MKHYPYRVLIIGLAALMLIGCAGQNTSDKMTETPEVIVSTIKATGIVTPKTWAKVSFSTNGKLIELPVESGDRISSGGVLGRLDDISQAQTVKVAELQIEEARVNQSIAQNEMDRVVTWSPNKNSVAAAEAALANAQAGVKEAQAAYDKVQWVPSVSASAESLQLEQATNNYNVAKANLNYLYSSRPDIKIAADNLKLADLAFQKAELNHEIAQKALMDTTLRAPFAGTINELYVHEGEEVTPGSPVMLIADLSTLRVETTDLNESDVVNVEVGNRAVITFEALPGIEVMGRVAKIADKAGEGSGANYTIIIELDEIPKVIRWGMTAYVEIPMNEG